MAGSRELGFLKKTSGNLKERLVRTTLQNVRSQGHIYVELREDGKKLIFFCTLCLAPCYSDSILFDHLKGNLHSERLAAAKATLLKPNPWPFNDGVFFFYDDASEQDKSLPVSTAERFKLLETHHGDEDNLAIINCDEMGPKDISRIFEDDLGCYDSSHDQHMNGKGSYLVIPGVLQKEDVSDLVVSQIGIGRIVARVSEKNGLSQEIRRIWCEWLMNKEFADDENDLIPEHDFAVISFAYNYNLGRKALIGDIRYLLPSSIHSDAEDSGSSRKKRKSFSDPEDISVALSNQNDSSGEESQSSNNPNSKLLLSGNDDQLVQSRIIVSKTMRKELRRQHTVASERLCDICQQKMLPGKDVAALLNRKTGRLVCSSRNMTGAFHVFHISCLIRWILLCESEIYVNPSVATKPKRRSQRKVRVKDGKKGKKDEIKATSRQIYSVFCPECQGTGIETNGEEREKPTVPLSEMFKYKIKLSDAHKSWMKHPEVLQNCSMGFHFPSPSEDIGQENVVSLKLLRFYRAND